MINPRDGQVGWANNCGETSGDIFALEREIDRLVYGLTEREVEVEESDSESK